MRCKDYYIFKTRYYADEKLLDKWHNGGTQPQQHWDRAQNHNKFIWDLIKKVSGKDDKYWMMQYMSDSKECALDYIEENFDIKYSDSEGWITIFVPKSNEKIFKWCKINCKNPWKVLKKTRLGAFSYNRNLKWRREMSRDFTLKMRLHISKLPYV